MGVISRYFDVHGAASALLAEVHLSRPALRALDDVGAPQALLSGSELLSSQAARADDGGGGSSSSRQAAADDGAAGDEGGGPPPSADWGNALLGQEEEGLCRPSDVTLAISAGGAAPEGAASLPAVPFYLDEVRRDDVVHEGSSLLTTRK